MKELVIPPKAVRADVRGGVQLTGRDQTRRPSGFSLWAGSRTSAARPRAPRSPRDDGVHISTCFLCLKSSRHGH